MKVIKLIFLTIFILIWFVGTSPLVSRWADQLHLISDGYQNGDLYRLSNLPQFKEPRKLCTTNKPTGRYDSKRSVHLYIIGDSFTEKDRIGKDNFGADQYHYTHWSQVLHFKPDTAATNILLLETVERHFREKFDKSPIRNLIADSATYNASDYQSNFRQELDLAFSSAPAKDRFDNFLFQNPLLLKLKELKASFNNIVFDRPNQEVTLVNGGKDIVYYMDTDVPNITSSFTPASNLAIDSIVNNLNATTEVALQMGFDKVLLSVIPNKVSAIAPHYGKYNSLITRVYRHPKLVPEYIDVLPEFQKLGTKAYLKGDSHWTCEGQNLWVNKVNRKIGEALLPF